MSDLPGEITKQILSAPPRIILSTRYSLTARGRKASPSRRQPTGSSSFEKARGCILLPLPAAGMIPHISVLLLSDSPLPVIPPHPARSEQHRARFRARARGARLYEIPEHAPPPRAQSYAAHRH